jgi:ABC-type transport system involved in multi-copper enzyme maturation permease subunit
MRQFFFNPVMIKELRGRMRGARAFVILSIYLGITAAVTLLVYLAVAGASRTDLTAGRVIGQTIFWTVSSAALVLVCVISPSLTAGAVAGEKERQTYDLLVTTLLSPWQIALGKLVSALAFSLLLILAMLPLASLAFLFGGVSGTELVLAVVGLFVTAVLYATVGLFWSTVMRGTLGATVLAQGSIIAVLLGIPFIFLVTSAIFATSDATRDLTNSPFFIYGFGALLFSHPFIALGYSEVLLKQGENPFYFNVPGQQNLVAPAPWLAYTMIASILTFVFLLLSVRMLRPVQEGEGRPQKEQAEVKAES